MLHECYMDIEPSFPMLPWNYMFLSEVLLCGTSENFQHRMELTLKLQLKIPMPNTENLRFPQTAQTEGLMVGWSISIRYTESPKPQKTEGQIKDFLIFICIVRTSWPARMQQVPPLWQARSNTEQEPVPTLLALVIQTDTEGKRDKERHSEQRITARQGRAVKRAQVYLLPQLFVPSPLERRGKARA